MIKASTVFALFRIGTGHAVAELVEAGRSRVQFPVVALDLFVDTILPATL
jgi:hypothetical protein